MQAACNVVTLWDARALNSCEAAMPTSVTWIGPPVVPFDSSITKEKAAINTDRLPDPIPSAITALNASRDTKGSAGALRNSDHPAPAGAATSTRLSYRSQRRSCAAAA